MTCAVMLTWIKNNTEFLAVRKDHSFFECCQTPEIACELTMQPIRRFKGLLDAAIIFCDILVVPQAMGMTVEMNPAPVLLNPIRTPQDLERLPTKVDINKELGYVFESVNLTRRTLQGEVPLIGFCGAPWTLMAYMVEGGGSKTYQNAKAWLYKWPEHSHDLLTRIANVCVDLLVGQVIAGAQVSIVQPFFVVFALRPLDKHPNRCSKSLIPGPTNSLPRFTNDLPSLKFNTLRNKSVPS